jgi:hypothetical protein
VEKAEGSKMLLKEPRMIMVMISVTKHKSWSVADWLGLAFVEQWKGFPHYDKVTSGGSPQVV